MKTVVTKLALIKPYWRNPRNNEASVAALVNSITEFGYTNPIVVDKKNVILAGHARFQALLRLKWEEAPVIRLTSLTEEQARRFRIADNKAGELSEWDLDKLKKEVDDLGFESVSVFFDSDQWRSLLSVAEMTAESSADMKEVVGYAPGEAQPAAPEIQLLCPHCLEELAFTKDQLSELVTASKAEAEKS